MSGFMARRSGTSERVKNMMAMIKLHPEENSTCESVNYKPSENNKIIEQDVTAGDFNKDYDTNNKILHPNLPLEDTLYQKPYSMTSQVFDEFIETQITYDVYSSSDFDRTLNILNSAFPSNNSELSNSHLPQSLTSQSSENLEYDSDDSVKDKDYIPSSEEDSISGDSEVEIQELRTLKNPVGQYLVRRHSSSATMRVQQDENTNVLSSCNKRRVTIDGVAGTSSSVLLVKRKKYAIPLRQRKIDKQNQIRNKYNVKTGCNEKCLKKCSSLFTAEDRQNINNMYWNMTHAERKVFIRTNYVVTIPKRKYTDEPQRNPKRAFSLLKSDGTLVTVCKIFFLTTLGFKKGNDRVLTNSTDLNKDINKRGKHTKTQRINREQLTNHIESFQPSAPHYRREHAPNRRYLPNEISVKFMYDDYCLKYPEEKVNYELYRTHLKAMNISFTRLGNEECEICESYRLHTLETKHNVSPPNVQSCTICIDWDIHHQKYKKARELYDKHKSLERNTDHLYFSSDLEKVIMLPRLDTFKAVIFCPRLIAFNQTFAPVGKITKQHKPLAVIWHDAVAGRKQEDIMSAYYNFFIKYRDIKNINLWLDNCTAQNKNWLLFSMLVGLVNSQVLATDCITLYYFEPGHTFMSCDQFHHQVELSMKRKKKIYDFTDFEDAVASANNGKVFVKSLTGQDFINYPNNISDRRIQTSNPRAYLKNMTQVSFIKGSFDLHYKNDFSQDYIPLKFLNDKYLKNPQFNLIFRTKPKGIEEQRKVNIISKLSPIIPTHKMLFWYNLPTCKTESNEVENKKSFKRNTL